MKKKIILQNSFFYVKYKTFQHFCQVVWNVFDSFCSKYAFAQFTQFYCVFIHFACNICFKVQIIIMEECNISRKLSSRERRRLKVHKMLPIDALSPSCTPRASETIDLYHYGCRFEDSKTRMEVQKGLRKCSSTFFLRFSLSLHI